MRRQLTVPRGRIRQAVHMYDRYVSGKVSTECKQESLLTHRSTYALLGCVRMGYVIMRLDVLL
jgi:hypothetical protein